MERDMKRTQRALVFGGVALLAAIAAGAAVPAGGAPGGPANNILGREFAIEAGQTQLRAAQGGKALQGGSGGVMHAVKEGLTTPSCGAAAPSIGAAKLDAPASAPVP